MILHEIQHAPDLLSYVKDRVDEDRRAGRWLFTGSQNLALMRGVSQTLAGRIAVLSLDPLSAAEVVDAPPIDSIDDLLARVFEDDRPRRAAGTGPAPALGDWLLRGGYPEPRLRTEVDRRLWFGSYVQTYLERDVRDLATVGDLAAFGRFVFLLAARSGQILNMADLGRDAGVTGPTVKHWLSVLQASHVVHLLPPHHRSFGKRIRKSPKVYFLDPGLASFLLGLHTEEAVLQGPSAGALVETATISEWMKAFRSRGEPPSLFHWRSSGGVEVDLVVERGGRIYGVEVKATATPVPRHVEGLATWLKLAGARARGVLACAVDHPVALTGTIRAVPWHLAW